MCLTGVLLCVLLMTWNLPWLLRRLAPFFVPVRLFFDENGFFFSTSPTAISCACPSAFSSWHRLITTVKTECKNWGGKTSPAVFTKQFHLGEGGILSWIWGVLWGSNERHPKLPKSPSTQLMHSHNSGSLPGSQILSPYWGNGYGLPGHILPSSSAGVHLGIWGSS